MWTGVIVLLVVLVLAVLALRVMGPRPRKSPRPRTDPGVQPGRDYHYW
jgi:hypothetical protein